MKQDPAMSFPLNLLYRLDLSEKSKYVSDDRLAGIEYAISTLPKDSQQWISLRFREGLSSADTAQTLGMTPEQEKALESDTLQKIRGTSRMNWIRFGIEGNVRRIKSFTRAEAYEDGYRKGLDDGHSGKVPHSPDAVTLALPLSALSLSNRVLTLLLWAGYTTVSSLLNKDEIQVMQIQGLGVRGVGEVGLALRKLGITGTAWERYIRE